MADLRFPIGEFEMPPSFDVAACQSAVDAIEKTPEQLVRGVAGLTDDQLDTPYRPEGWTVRQVVHHLADSHINAYCRCKLALTEDVPTIRTYDEKAWADLTEARTGAVTLSMAILEAVHLRWVASLRSLSEADFLRRLDHPELGAMRLFQLLHMYGWHGPHHIAHITALRTRRLWD
jgi:hypothetical protein